MTGIMRPDGRMTARKVGRQPIAVLLALLLALALVPSAEAQAQAQTQTAAPWDIESVQHRLVELGYDLGEVDGLLGPATRDALRAFQEDRGLPVTGLPDGDTQQALFEVEAPEPPAVAQPPAEEPPAPEAIAPEAIPAEPVEAAPLSPTSPEIPSAEGGIEEGTTLDLSLAQGTADDYATEQAELRSRWIKWVAATLAALGVLAFFAAVRFTVAKAKTAPAPKPRPKPRAPQPLIATPRPAPVSIVRNGHVYGVDIPSFRASDPK